ncbi:non-hydrolyzing UDP-N-acetylglucosamine 2-epimerase [Rugamonas sp. DEMB1]|uniref:non-hydrolyzing UDP-N-acetylglucosamine 2-epimerase n=1 Tax=Rugamonas sp. DEMB1 TaxID=3039386 RepID=UPI00244A5C62|nr:UDP-N-acetylglucosamine 2-epimerase (non-hydrolyzing) [Rugamonas sp. DEMB1]WGG52997.1 UDP-N-acetylglucosamine 2-epimerase (non-hydrolyzing) [Rugamonas sp. DEMB1]
MPDTVPPHRAHLLCVVAARPNLMKMAPILAALGRLRPAVDVSLVHTGQHDDAAMDARQFAALGLAPPQLDLAVGQSSHAQQTAEVMRRFEPALRRLAPQAVLLVGDVNSTLACALVAAKLGVPVLHVEAGLRSYDRRMPEEINRVLTDQLAELLFTSEPAALNNLLLEGVAAARIHHVGNVMIDSLLAQLPRAVPTATVLARAGRRDLLAAGQRYAVLTLQRPANVDHPARLRKLMAAVRKISQQLPVIFPLDPHTRARLGEGGLLPPPDAPGVACLPPADYLEMLGLMKDASVVLTDSGGVQEETTALGVPCLTLRENTERPITVSEGSNTVAGHDPAVILALCEDILRHGGKTGRRPALWDGQAAGRIAGVVDAWLQRRGAHAR